MRILNSIKKASKPRKCNFDAMNLA